MRQLMLSIVLLSVGLYGQFVPNFSTGNTDDATSLLLNPAGLGISRGFNFLFLGSTDLTKFDSVQNDYSILFQTGRTGIGYTYLGEGRDLIHWGNGEHVGKGIYLGSTSHFSQDGYEAVDFGVLYRGFSWFSVGTVWKNLWSRERGRRSPYQLGLGIAFRPFGNRFTFAYDHRLTYEAKTFTNETDLGGRAQVKFEPVDGIILFSSYDTKNQGIQLGLSVGFGEASIETYHDLDKEREYSTSLIGFQFSGDIRRTIFKKRTPTYIELAFEIPIEDSPNPIFYFGPKTITLKKLTDQIHKMADNLDIDGIILKPDSYSTGIGMMKEVHDALSDFKKSGKKVFAFMDMGGDRAYAMACVADSIYLNSGGFIDVDGLSIGIGFLKGLFDKIGVDAQFYRRGDYKTAAEPFTRKELTETSREAYEAVLEDMHTVFSEMITEGRGWSSDKLEEVYDGALYTPQMAIEAGLVDGIYYHDQIKTRVEKIVGEEVKIVKTRKQPKQWVYDWEAAALPQIAIIYAEGPIYPGKSKPSPFSTDKVIGGETTAKMIRKAREDKSVKAIVMRVNSPGGSILGSEEIWREVHRTTHPDSADKENQKPFFVSMGDVAGSGGYYISCAADTIVADRGCITGSIGVLSGKISLGGLFEKIGFNVDVIKEQPHADQFAMHRSFTEEEGQRMQEIVDSYYEQFLRRVSEGREMTRDEVDKIAQGRIWSAVDARENGLVDIVGGLDKAIEVAEEKAGLKEGEYNLKIYKGFEDFGFKFEVKTKSDIQSLIELFDTEIPFSKMLDRAKLINDERFLYLMDEEIIIQ